MDTIIIEATTVKDLLFLIGGLLAGILMGMGISGFFSGHREKKEEAPAPYDLGYNPNNPINGGSGYYSQYRDPRGSGYTQVR